MKKRTVLFLLGWGAAVFADDAYRTFTDQQGRETKAKVLKVDPRSGQVTVEREGGAKATVPATLFSATDQAYIKEWLAAQDFMSNTKLRVTVEKNQGKKPDDDSLKRAKTPCSFGIKLENRSPVEFGSLQVAYCMYMSHSEKHELTKERFRSDPIRLAAGQSHQLESKVMQPYAYYESQQDHYYDSNGNTTYDTSYNKIGEDEIEGIRVRIYLTTASGTLFQREICSPSSVEKKFAWEEFTDADIEDSKPKRKKKV